MAAVDLLQKMRGMPQGAPASSGRSLQLLPEELAAGQIQEGKPVTAIVSGMISQGMLQVDSVQVQAGQEAPVAAPPPEQTVRMNPMPMPG